MEIGVMTETWVIPHCKYIYNNNNNDNKHIVVFSFKKIKLCELFYKRIGNQEAAMEQFKWVLKGPRPTSRGVLIPLDSITSTSTSMSTNPDKFRKYEFSRVLKQRCTVAIDQIKSGSLLTSSSSTNAQNSSSSNDNDNDNNKSFHIRKKSGSSSGYSNF